jgi:hypothetical protein
MSTRLRRKLSFIKCDEFVEIEKKFVIALDKVDGLDSIDDVLNLGKKAINVCPSLGFEVSQFIDPFLGIY